jgi:hypothetical protein
VDQAKAFHLEIEESFSFLLIVRMLIENFFEIVLFQQKVCETVLEGLSENGV